MNPLRSLFVPALLFTTPAAAPAQEVAPDPPAAAPAPAAPAPQVIAGWGTVTDPAGDCKVNASGGSLAITMPADCPAAHNLCAELESMDAPRVLQSVTGDFDLEVKVEATYTPGTKNGTGSRVPYQGAGLAVFADGTNYIRLERAAMLFGDLRDYINFEIRVDGELERFGSNEKFPLDPAKPVWLRLERRGESMRGGMRQEGTEWAWGEPKSLTSAAWKSAALTAGVHAVSSSFYSFAPVFSELQCGAPRPPVPAEKPAADKAAPPPAEKEPEVR